jgi:hypothetical protein
MKHEMVWLGLRAGGTQKGGSGELEGEEDPAGLKLWLGRP